MSHLIELGYVTKAFGIKGGLTIKLFAPESETIRPGVSLTLKKREQEHTFIVKEIVPNNRIYLVGILDRNEAQALEGSTILIEREALLELDEDEFYLSDMKNARVILKDKSEVGKVHGFSSNGAQTLLEVILPSGHIASIPLVKPIVVNVDLENKEITIDPPAGLLDV